MSFQNNFTPGSTTILSITNANPGVVTTASNHGFKEGIYVRLNIPMADGMQQVNGNVYLATILSANSFAIDADTTNYDSFAILTTKQAPQVIPVGEVALTLKNAEQNSRNIIPEN